MKKLSLFVAPIMAASFLIGCGGGGNKPEEAKFFVTDDTVEYDATNKQAEVQLKWMPSSNSVECSDFKFIYGTEGAAPGTTSQKPGDHPLNITIAFSEGLTADTDGTLTFHYTDKTAGVAADGRVENIHILMEDPHEVDETEFNAALGFDGVSYLQINEGTDEYKFSPDAYFAKSTEIMYSEIFVFKENSQYNRYFSRNSEDDFILIENVDSTQLVTPQNFDDRPSIILSPYGLTYENFEYNKTLGVYTATHQISETTFTLKFENKKIVKMDIDSPGNNIKSSTYAYEETPLVKPTLQAFDGLNLQSTVTTPSKVSIDNGNIHIKFNNAQQLLDSDSTLSVQCFLENETLSEGDTKVYSSVEGYSKTGTADTYCSATVDVDADKQCWNFTFDQFYPVNSEFYLTIRLNKNFIAPSGRTVMETLPEEVDCYLAGDESTHFYAVWIAFDDIAAPVSL